MVSAAPQADRISAWGWGQDLAYWDLKSRQGLGSGIDTTGWGLRSRLDNKQTTESFGFHVLH